VTTRRAPVLRPEEHIKELTGIVGRLLRRIASRRAAKLPCNLEERELASIKWVVMEAYRANEFAKELRALRRSLPSGQRHDRWTNAKAASA